jgi:hypothetical protein
MYNYASIEYSLANNVKENWELFNLISISNNGKSISSPGDSGAAVLDDENRVLGIVVAGSDKITYAIPIKTILDNLNLTIL